MTAMVGNKLTTKQTQEGGVVVSNVMVAHVSPFNRVLRGGKKGKSRDKAAN